MNAPTNVQTINGPDGKPAYVVVPWNEWQAMQRCNDGTVPNEVVHLVFDNEWSPMRAWREYLGLTQAEVARRLGVSQAAYAQSEAKQKPRKTTLGKAAAALGLSLEQLDF
jgi:DNA-binding XRE family transcriptional regulator